MESVKPNLVILAAGLGSRFGGVKQMEGVGPGGEILLDYSVYDAIAAGFKKLVLVIRPELEADFRERITSKFEDRIEVSFVYQCLEDLPEGIEVPEGRSKPWGTGHALLCAAKAVDGPFCVINADDYYGQDAFAVVGDQLKQGLDEKTGLLVAYRLDQTLSDHGSVSRGVCSAGEGGVLKSIVEHTGIQRGEDGIVRAVEPEAVLEDTTAVSLNLWGFPVAFMKQLESGFRAFLSNLADPMKSEYYLPEAATLWIEQGGARVLMKNTKSRWLGMTYREDRDAVKAALKAWAENGVYPERLWE